MITILIQEDQLPNPRRRPLEPGTRENSPTLPPPHPHLRRPRITNAIHTTSRQHCPSSSSSSSSSPPLPLHSPNSERNEHQGGQGGGDEDPEDEEVAELGVPEGGWGGEEVG